MPIDTAQRLELLRSNSEPVHTFTRRDSSSGSSGPATPQDGPQDQVVEVRRSSITFAPQPLDSAFLKPRADAQSIVERATMGTLIRHFEPLTLAYQHASPDLHADALALLAKDGSALFAKYLQRHMYQHPNLTWDLKSVRQSSKPRYESAATRLSLLTEFSDLSFHLSDKHKDILKKAESFRGLMVAEMAQFVEAVFAHERLEPTPEMYGALVGAMLDGAAHVISEMTTFSSKEALATVLAFCNALQVTFASRDPSEAARRSRRTLSEKLDYWTTALDEKPLAITERMAQIIALTPKFPSANDLTTRLTFARAMRNVRDHGYGTGPTIQNYV